MCCQKSKRICPGYRDPFELKLRDQTKSTKSKLSSSHDKHGLLTPKDLVNTHFHPYNQSRSLVHPTALPPSCSWIEYDNYHWGDESFSQANNGYGNYQSARSAGMAGLFLDQPARIKKPLSTPLDQQAVCFFVANYVLVPGPETMTARGYLDFLLPLLNIQPANSPLALTFTSIGLAAMAVRPNSRALMPMARLSYIKALKQINFALRDPSTAMSDTTLAAILLLTLFEQITSTGMELKGWRSHIHGAVAVIKNRGKKSLQTQVGREVFIVVRELMVSCSHAQRLTRNHSAPQAHPRFIE
jgi:hypothetical protein